MVMLREPVRRGQAESRARLPTPTCSSAPARSPQHHGRAHSSPDSKGQCDGWKIPCSQEIWPFTGQSWEGLGTEDQEQCSCLDIPGWLLGAMERATSLPDTVLAAVLSSSSSISAVFPSCSGILAWAKGCCPSG